MRKEKLCEDCYENMRYTMKNEIWLCKSCEDDFDNNFSYIVGLSEADVNRIAQANKRGFENANR